MPTLRFRLLALALILHVGVLTAADPPPAPDWYEAMKQVNSDFTGNPGYVAQFGDSITYTSGFWVSIGWMNADEFLGEDGFPKQPKDKRWRDILKGFRAKGPEHGNLSGWTVGNLLATVPEVLKREGPEAAIIGIGTNDTGPNGADPSYGPNLEKVIRMCLDAHCIPILNTIPPKRGCMPGVEKTNNIIRELAKKHSVPLVDYYAEIMKRQPGNAWDGTLISKDGVHPSLVNDGNFSEANLAVSGYSLRTWLNFLAVRELYFRVLSTPKPFVETVGAIEPVRQGIRCPVIADTEVSIYADAKDNERVWNWGKAPRLKLKGFEEYVLMKFDTRAAAGMTIKRATMYFSRTEQCVLNVVSATTVSSDWQEGTGTGQPSNKNDQASASVGGATFLRAVSPDATWAGPGSNFKWAVYGEGGSLWSARETGWSKDEKADYYTVEIEPAVAQALLIDGDTYGLAFTEEKGQRAFQSTYRRVPNPNHFINASESDKPCFLVIEGEVNDKTPPSAITNLAAKAGAEAGDLVLSWTCTGDDGDKGTAQGYRIYVSAGKLDGGKLSPKDQLPRHLTYRPKAAGVRQEMPIVGLKPGAEYSIAVVAYDEVGNASPAALSRGTTRVAATASLKLPAPATAVGTPMAKGSMKVWAAASTERINPISGNAMSEGSYLDEAAKGAYRNGNDVWDGKDHRVAIFAGRNDFAGFQVVVENAGGSPMNALEVTCSGFAPETKNGESDRLITLSHKDPAAFQEAMGDVLATDKARGDQIFADIKRMNGLKKKQTEDPAAFFQEMSDLKARDRAEYDRWMNILGGGTGASAIVIAPKDVEIFWQWGLKEKAGGWYPDALIPLDGPLAIPNKDNGIAGQRHQTFFIDVFVPHDTPPGTYSGSLAIRTRSDAITLPVRLTVWNFSLPDRITFQSEMNGYQYPEWKGPDKWEGSLNMHRLAHRNRVNVNIVPVSHAGNFIVPQMAMEVSGSGAGARVSSFDDFDRYFGPLLSGKAFEKNPRAGVPVRAFYLPLYENWPTTTKDGFVFDQSARHLDVTQDFTKDFKDAYVAVGRQLGDHLKKRGWTDTEFQVFLNSKYQYAPEITFWLLDEPMFRDDYKVIEMFGDLTRKAFKDSAPIQVNYRIDCSRVEETRGMLNTVDTFVGTPSNMTQFRRPFYDQGWTYARKIPSEPRSTWVYGGAGSVTSSNVTNRSWTIDAFLSGHDGLLPWLSYGGQDAWDSAEAAENAIFYPANRWNYNGPYGSLRLKSFRDGQQDAECLRLLCERLTVTRSDLRTLLSAHVDLHASVKADTSMSLAAEVDRLSYDKLSPDDLSRIRRIVGFNLDQAATR